MPLKNRKAESSRTESLSGMSVPTAATPIGSSKSQHCRQLALLILKSRA
jgi:hypothetical protein